MSVPPFSLTAPRYDMSTYWGRTKYFVGSVNPKRMFHSSATIARSQQLLQQFAEGKGNKAVATDADLWEARAITEACAHPKSGETIFPLFRMAAFVPVNFFIVPFMLLPSTITSVSRTVFIHWLNQSYNCAVNYSNRSSDALPLSALMPAYVGAVSVSVSMALGATALVRRLPTGSAAATLTRALIPFAAVSASSSANVAITRRSEWSQDGVDIKDATGTVVGKSTAAGWYGLTLCAWARVAWNIPCMVLPIAIATPLFRSFPAIFNTADRRMYLEVVLTLLGVAFGVPPALAIFPPQVEFPVSRLEPALREKLAKERPDLHQVRFYKGL